MTTIRITAPSLVQFPHNQDPNVGEIRIAEPGEKPRRRFVVKARPAAALTAVTPVTAVSNGTPALEKAPKRKLTYDEKLDAQGLRRVSFVLPIPLWGLFMKLVAKGSKPNSLFIDWVRESVTARLKEADAVDSATKTKGVREANNP